MTRRQWRNAAIFAGSVAAHLLVLAAMGALTPGLRTRPAPEEPAIEATLVTPRLNPRPVPARAEGTTTPLSRAPAPRPRAVAPITPPAGVAPLPLPPAQPGSGGGAPGAKGGAGRDWTVFPSAEGEARRILRTSPFGCANRDAVGLNRREREICDDRYGEGAKSAKPIAAPMDADKRRRFDRQARSQEGFRAYRDAPPSGSGIDQSAQQGMPVGAKAVGPGGFLKEDRPVSAGD